jgi:hypothetical protein
MKSSTKPQPNSPKVDRAKLASNLAHTSGSRRRWPKLSHEQREKAMEQFHLSRQDRPFSAMPAKDDMPPLRN